MAHHADCGRIVRVTNQTLSPGSALGQSQDRHHDPHYDPYYSVVPARGTGERRTYHVSSTNVSRISSQGETPIAANLPRDIRVTGLSGTLLLAIALVA